MSRNAWSLATRTAAVTAVAAAFAVGALLAPVFARFTDGGSEARTAPSQRTSVPLVDRGPLRLTPTGVVPGPIAMAQRRGDDSVLVATLDGTVIRLDDITRPEGANVADELVLDLRSAVLSGQGEQGMFDLAFTPEGDHLLVSYTDLEGALVVDGFDATDLQIEASERVEILRVPQRTDNHNGGGLSFGPDGSLFIGLGDGGSNDGPTAARSLLASQDADDLFGSLLRITPDLGNGGYSIPPDNPFVGGAGRDEIWLYGLRNPFKQFFDEDGALWIPDTGGADREEINRFAPPDLGRGSNLGWGLVEGTLPVLGSTPPPGHVPPVFEYTHDEGRCAITAGVRVAGDRYPDLTGKVLFSDFCAGAVMAIEEQSDGSFVQTAVDVDVEGADRLDSVVGIEQIGDEVYVLDLRGTVYRFDGR